MALSSCIECGNELSSHAKACPHCGMPLRRRATIKAIGSVAFSLLFLCVLFIALQIGAATPGNSVSHRYPACTSDDATRYFRRAFDNSQYAKMRYVHAIDVINQTKISGSRDSVKLICQATFMLNNAKQMTYQFTFAPGRHGHFYMTGHSVVK